VNRIGDWMDDRAPSEIHHGWVRSTTWPVPVQYAWDSVPSLCMYCIVVHAANYQMSQGTSIVSRTALRSLAAALCSCLLES
jgi:hypothetical protein